MCTPCICCRLKPKTPRTRGAEAREKAAGEDQPHGRKPLAEGAGTGGRKEREWPLGDDATENDLTLASNVPRLLVSHDGNDRDEAFIARQLEGQNP